MVIITINHSYCSYKPTYIATVNGGPTRCILRYESSGRFRTKEGLKMPKAWAMLQDEQRPKIGEATNLKSISSICIIFIERYSRDINFYQVSFSYFNKVL